MKSLILFAMLSSAVCLSCTHKQQQAKPGTMPDKTIVNSISDAKKRKAKRPVG